MQQAPTVTFTGAQSPAPRVSQYPAPYAPGQTEDWTSLITAIMPLILLMMMFGMMKPMFESMTK